MLPSLILLVAPLGLVAPVSAAPQPKVINIGVNDAAKCVGAQVTRTVTVMETVYADEPGQTSKPTGLAQSAPASTFVAQSHATSRLNVAQTQQSQPTQPTQATPENSSTPGSAGRASTFRNALYFTNWGIYGANFQPQQLPASQISHLLYAFADIGSDGEVKSSDSYADLQKHYPTDSWNDQGNNIYGCMKQIYLLKKRNRGMKVLLSIGGWTYSPKFAPVAATEAGRSKFASSAVKLVEDWGLDGIDIDWEYPANANEAQNFVLLLQACRQALDDLSSKYAPGYHFIISVAAPAGPSNIQNMDVKGMDPWIDSWNVMTYDYAGSWDSTSGHQANIYSNPNNPGSTKFNTEQAVRLYLQAGIPASKITMGLPLYGRSFEATKGLGQSYNGIGAGSIQSGVWLFRDLPRSGAQEQYDDVAKASYSYDPGSQELISYDTVTSAVQKVRYLVDKGLGGAFFWEASGDKPGSSSLVGAVATQLRDLDNTQNLLSYPASQYDNLRAGMPGS